MHKTKIVLFQSVAARIPDEWQCTVFILLLTSLYLILGVSGLWGMGQHPHLFFDTMMGDCSVILQ